MKRLHGVGWVVLGLMVAGAAPAQPSRAELLQQRQVAQSRYELELQACQVRFAVTACVDEARLRWRVADGPLREAQLQSEAQDRQARAAERLGVVAEKQRLAAARRSQPASSVVAAPAAAAASAARR